MAYPVLLNTPTGLLFNATGTAKNITMPATVTAGDLLRVWTCNANNVAGGTVPTDWTLVDEQIDHAWLRIRCYIKVADGTEDGTTVNFATASAVASGLGAVLEHYQVGTWEAHGLSAGVSADPAPGVGIDPDAVTASASGTHRFAVFGAVTGSGTVTPPTGYTEQVEASTDGFDGITEGCTFTLCYKEAEAASDDPANMVFSDDDHTACFTGLVEGTGTAYDQEGFRWRNDDGSETTATWRQDQDVDDTAAAAEAVRLRILTDTSGSDPPSGALRLQYKRSDEPDSEWRDV